MPTRLHPLLLIALLLWPLLAFTQEQNTPAASPTVREETRQVIERLAHPSERKKAAFLTKKDAEELLSPVDASSPRTLIIDFISGMNENYATAQKALGEYLMSDRLYPGAEEKARFRELAYNGLALSQVLDLSDLPADERSKEFAIRRVMMLKEILDRIELPPVESIPDARMMKDSGATSWEIPGTNLYLELDTESPGSGRYRLSKESVNQLPETYERIEAVPYQPGATPYVYPSYKYGFGGLLELLPLRWLLEMPDWSRYLIFDQPLWRWLALGLVIVIGLVILITLYRVSHALTRRFTKRPALQYWLRVVLPVATLLFLAFLRLLILETLRFTTPVYHPLMAVNGALTYLTLVWLTWSGASALVESMIAVRDLRRLSIDSQLMRLTIRFLALVVSIAILIQGAQRLGMPAYSIVTGLGVGGLAVAFAGREALANLLGSFVIMLEQPFRIGHWVRFGQYEGVVEEVGFRSTRIRSFSDSLITIPSSKVLETEIDNLGLRRHRRIKTNLYFSPEIGETELKALIEEIAQTIRAHPAFAPGDDHIVLHDFRDSLIDVLLYFFIQAEDWQAELLTREAILHEVRGVIDRHGVRFAFPTQEILLQPESRKTIDPKPPSAAG